MQRHLDRLSSIDASFLHQEGPSLAHAHRRGADLRGSAAADFDDFLDHVRSRLHLVPRYRQKLATPPLETGRPLWVDDPDFNIEYHVRHTALPAPGQRGAAVPADRADRLPAARPRQAAVGELAGRGARGRPVRADLEDPPLAGRRRRRGRSGDRAVRSRARPARPAPRTTRAVAAPGESRRRSSCVAAGVRGSVGRAAGVMTRRRVRGRRAGAPRVRASSATPPRASARSSGPGSTPPRRRR